MENDIKALRRSVGLLAVLSVFVVAYFARDLILPVLLGFLIALTLSPINRALQKIGLPAGVSAALLIFLAASAILGVVYFAGEVARSATEDVPGIMLELKEKLSGLTKTIDAVQDASKEVQDVAGPSAAGPQEVIIQQPGLLNSAVSVAASTITSLGVALGLALFLLASGDLFYEKLVQTFPTMREKKRALSTIYGVERQVSGYLLTITVINIGLGVIVAFALWILGLEYAIFWGIAAALLNFLPILGGLAGTVLVAVHAVIFFDSLAYAFAAPIIYQVLTSTEAQFVTPYLIGKRMELNIVAVFLTVVLWAWLWGIAGALVAVPFLLVFKVVCDNFEGLGTFANFLGPATPRPRSKDA
jgi:predicted PurR-regulated permease PerM